METEKIKIRQPRKLLTDEEKKAREEKKEKEAKKAEKMEDIEKMLRIFSNASALVAYANKRFESCEKSMKHHLSGIGNAPGDPLFEHYSKVGLDISLTLAAQQMAIKAIQELDKEIKEMRMNEWKRVIIKIRGEFFDLLHGSMLSLGELNTKFGEIANMQGSETTGFCSR